MKRLSPTTLFESNHLSKDLALKSVRGGATTMTAQGIQFILNLFGTMVLARLLTPNDYGLVGMVTVVVNFVAMFKDAGLSMATVQRDKISHEQISTLFWLNVFISAFLGLCVLICSPLVAWFYDKPELTAVTAALSISFIITGLTIQHSALLRRHMQFGALAFIQITSYSLNIIVAIVLALAGFKYWALVGGTITLSISGTLLTLYFCPWLPGRIKKGSGTRDMLKFGGHLTGFNFINYFSRNADNMLIGKFIGADALGLYAKAYQIVYMPITNIRNPINSVAIPVLSSLKNDPEKFRRYYAKIVFIIAFFSMPIMAFCIMFPKELILLVFGEKWISMAGIFRLLAIVGFIQPVSGTKGALLIACGQSKLYLYTGIITAIISIVGFCIGIIWGVVGVAASIVFVVYAIQYPMFSIIFKYVPVSFKDLLDNSLYIAVISWISIILSKTIIMLIPGLNNLTLLSGSLFMIIIFIILFLGIPKTRKDFLNSVAIFKKAF